ncbi:MAG: anti-sigma factor [Chloroflexota bacterium]
MNEQERNIPDCETLEALIPAYSVGATDPEETALVERLLSLCPQGAAELESYLALSEAMHYTAPAAQPPVGLHDKLMAAAAASGNADVSASAKAPKVVALGPSPSTPKSIPRVPAAVKAAEARPRWLSFNRVLGAAVGIAAALLIISNLYWVNQVNGLRKQQADTVALMRSQQDALASFGTGRADRVDLVSTNGSEANTVLATVLWSPQTPTALLFSDHLPALNPDRAYQLWVIQGETPIGVGVFQVDENGVGVMVFNSDAPMTEFNAVAITEEPAGGSEQPTTAPLAVAQV